MVGAIFSADEGVAVAVGTIPVSLAPHRFGETARRDAGGSSRWWSFSACRPSSSTRRGRRSRASTTRTDRTSRRSTRRSSSATRRTAGSDRSPAAWPAWLPFSPALLILPIPAFFRLTCYYYRGAYYKAFWADPPSCTVGEPRSSYWGENSFPLDPAERPSLHAVPVAGGPARSSSTTSGRRSGSPIRRPAPSRSASASARSCSRSTPCFSAATCSAVIRCVTSSAAASISCRARRWASRRTRA